MKARNHRLLIRADASSAIGIGHVMRCIALGQYWVNTVGEVHFACRPLPLTLKNRLSREGFTVHEVSTPTTLVEDAQRLRELSDNLNASALLLDGYQFDDNYQAIAFSGAAVHVVMDDCGHARHSAADCIINLNMGANAADYSPSSALLLMGPDYSLLRSEFLGNHGSTREFAETASKILVTFGGSDPVNATGWVVETLRASTANVAWQIRLLLGPGYNHREGLALHVSQDPRFEMIDSIEEVGQLYLWSDVAICGGGGSNWEMSLFGIPRIVVPIADNQVPGTTAMEAQGCCWAVKFGDDENLMQKVQQLMLSSHDRIQMMTASRQLVDGLGSQRITEALLKLIRRKESHGSTLI